ncbi:MAG: hypothetical protein BWZ04_01739 [Firmicutes bacterium ADurb.BinA205]|nr:MAG: hypothetical protein BWZ04_01739 [Firmicutes bacterium ADurb.BinA205]
MTDEITHEYDDIIGLPHHVSQSRRHMSNLARAAQFSAFAALKGYDDAISETARENEERIKREEEECEYFDDIII